jgi:hypothetical protein
MFAMALISRLVSTTARYPALAGTQSGKSTLR